MKVHDVESAGANYRRRLETVVYRSARKNLEKPAIVADSESWTYRELVSYADSVARLLLSSGIKNGEAVGVSAARQPETIGCLLGVLRAGGAYVPLDPAYPLERVRFIVDDAGINRLLLSPKDALAEWSSIDAPEKILFSEAGVGERLDGGVAFAPEAGSGSDRAYILYTSGSSGRPKGVSIRHSNLVNFLFWAKRVIGEDALKCVLASTSFSFDISAMEIWLPLLTGGTIVIAREAGQFHDLENKNDITMINTVPSVMIEILNKGELPASVKTVCLGGEALPRSLADAVYENPVGRLFNLYGPTETTVYSSYKLIERGTKSVSIGRPIANTSLYVLDDELNVVPPGESGELYIGGAGVGIGYLNQPELTERHFIPDPFAGNKESLLYRTGDLARVNAEGEFEYLGRIDQQVKLRGYRIELGEIESLLNKFGGITHSVVDVVKGPGGDEVLAAFLLSPDAVPDSRTLRDYLKGYLPAAMVPAVFVQLDKLPLSISGKLDRKALPNPFSTITNGKKGSPRHSSNGRNSIHKIWQETLSISAVDERADFFSLGGHSLMAGRLLSRVYEETGVLVSLKEFFSNPFVSSMETTVRERRKKSGRGRHLRPEPVEWESRYRPLSLNQEGIWFLSELNPDSTEYNLSWDLTFDSSIDPTALELAISTVFQRNEILKMGILSHEGKPVGFLESIKAPPINVLDLRQHAPENHNRLVDGFLDNETDHRFDLSKPPLFRIAVIIKQHGALVRLTLHHILVDGWSMTILEKELRNAYETARNRGRIDNGKKRLSFFDYAAWQRKSLTDDVQEKQVGYWKNRLKSAPALLDLPPDKPQKANIRSRAESLYLLLPKSVGNRLENVGRKELATPFVTFLSSFQLLLSRYTGQKTVNVGTVVSNREDPCLQDLIGFFVNTIALTTDIDPNESYRELLRKVRGQVAEDFDNKDVPFDRVVSSVNPERSQSRTPIFQVMFTLQNAWTADFGSFDEPIVSGTPVFVFENPNDRGESIEIYKYASNKPAKFALTVTLQAYKSGYFIVLEFDAEKFADSRLARLLGNWMVLISAICDDPDRPVGQLPILTDREIEFFDRQRKKPREGEYEDDLIALFRKSVGTFPAKTAVKEDGGEFSYNQIDHDSSRWANSLRRRGIGPGHTVAVSAPRSVLTIKAYLAILKAGATYLPLSPDDPSVRNDFILSDSKTRLILAEASDQERLGASNIEVLAMKDLDGEADPLEDEAPRGADSIAYLMYTSGSTGTPKGVEVCDRGIIRLVRGQDYAVLDDGEIYSHLSPLTFDASTFEIWASLLNGGTLVIAPGKRMSLAEVSDYLRSESVTTAFLTTPLFNQLVEEQLERLGTLRQIITGGDIMSASHARRLLSRYPDLHLVNAYGPTEGSAFTTCYRLDLETLSAVELVPIGYPLEGTTVDLIDGEGQMVPMGAIGEIHIGGEGVANGYRNRKDLTKKHFVRNPRYPKERCYRSGDLGRFLEDGSLQFLGRKDSQIKIRGYRVEAGEIEAKLNSYENISRSVVVALSDQQEKQLIAYVKPADKVAYLSLPDLRSFLSEQLPEYMLPSHYVIVDEFPLTSTGKLDLKRLPSFQFASDEAFKTPQTKMERLVAFHFEQVLNVRPIGSEGNFFHLGGHSLLATRLLARLRSELNVNMPLEVFFDTQTVSSVARYLENLERESEESTFPEIVKRKDTSEPPLSFAQQRLWFLERLHPEQGAYTILSTRIVESLDLEALRHAQNEMIGRHESLRTLFPSGESGEPFQNVVPPPRTDVRTLDYSACSPDERRARLSDFLKREATRRFDLETGPLFLMTAIKLDHKHSLLAATFHHIISDGWSMDIFWSEIHDLYCAFLENASSPLAPLDAQYVDFTYWQKEFISGPRLEKQLDYWRSIIGWVPPITRLPSSMVQKDEDDFQSATLGIDVPPKQRSALEKIARDERASLFMVLAAIFYTLVYRYTDSRDICIGIPLANRRVREAEAMIGFFVNTVPLRVDMSGSPSFREVVHRVRERALGAYANQDVPFEKIMEELHPGRYGAKNAFFDMMFSFQTSSQKGFRSKYTSGADDKGMNGRHTSGVVKKGNDSGVAKFLISLSATVVEDGVEFWLEYKSKSYEPEFIARFLKNLSVLVDSAISAPDAGIDELEILSQEERECLVTDWNQRKRPYDRTLSLPRYVEIQAEKTPNAPAIISDDVSLTYEDLVVATNKMANYLLGIGAKKGDIVALCVNRSVDMIVCQLAIMRIGAAYLPIDPQFPHERVKYMLEDSKVSVLLIHAEHSGSIPRGKWKTYALEKIAAKVERSPADPPEISASGDDVCYIIYTSGSTGRPNGAVVEHRGVANCVIWMQDEYKLDARDRVLLKESYCYDATVWETFWPLFHGAAVVIAAADKHLDGEYLSDLIHRRKVSVIYSVSSLLSFLYEELDVKKCRSIKHVFCGGEALSPKVLRRHYSHFRAPLHNWYGPTEASIGTVAWTCKKDFEGLAVPIGKPINNVRSYIVDRNRRLVPIGVSGELLLAGISVGRGYLGNVRLTSEKVIEDAFAEDKELDKEDRRMYRTGDFVRYDENGDIEYLGRIDNQLKIRGQRIEIGEIYSVIEKQPEIRESYISVKEMDGNQQLVLYVIWNPPADDLLIPEVRGRIRNELPEFMVPLLVSIPEMPHMENGKVDAKKLPEVESLNRQDFDSYIPPQNPLEEFVAAQFATLLNLERVGVYDDFFLLGGHSLLAAKLVAKLCKAFEIELPLKTVFEERNVWSISAKILGLIGRQTTLVERKPIRKWNWGNELRPLSHEQERMWFLSAMTGHSSAYNVIKTITIDGQPDADLVKTCLIKLATRHELLRSVFIDIAGQIFSQIIAPDYLQIDFSIEDLSERPIAETSAALNELFARHFSEGFSMSDSPVWRALLVRLPSGDSCLAVNLHHIIFDTWSGEILAKEFLALYEGETSNITPELPHLEIQYSDYAKWQRLGPGDLSEELRYWENELADAPFELYFASLENDSAEQMKFGAVNLTLKGASVDLFRDSCRAALVTTYVGLLAVWMITLSRVSKSETVRVGTPVSLRNKPEIQETIGLFLNTVVVAEKIDPHVSFRSFLGSLQKKIISHISHCDVPYEKVVDHLRNSSDGNRQELFDALFAHQMSTDERGVENIESVESGGDKRHVDYMESKDAKFPLSLYASESKNSLRLTFEFDKSRITEKMANTIITEFETVFYSVSKSEAV